MKHLIRLSMALLTVTVLIFYYGCDNKPENKEISGSTENVMKMGASKGVSDSDFLANAGSLAMNDPDKFNWTIFVRICQKANVQHGQSNNAIWETWPDDPYTYPNSPDLKDPPVWPADTSVLKQKVLEPIQQLLFLNQKKLNLKNAHIMIAPENGANEETRRNPASFNFIINNGLWYKQGLATVFNKRIGNGGTSYDPLDFPVDAIEVKAVWRKISKDSMAYFHWNYDNTGTLYGLIAFHIMTKAIPNWTWATWEWTGNPARCDDMGCHDAFGVTPANVNPNQQPNQGYPGGTLTNGLAQLFSAFGLSDEWKNYRLKGSQTDRIDATGRTTLVGNSITEEGFVASSSCMTCHSVASFDQAGNSQPTVGFIGDDSQNGPTDPKNFWANGKAPYGKLKYMPYDFVWGVRRAKAAKP